ncbi:MAG: protein-glutamate O-methyltransferase CheR [bacterium]|nr:protein-glutamate O-methyltransferase CheR [bacterium]
MDKKTYDKLRRIVYEQSGIDVKEGKMSMVASRIAARLRALSLDTESAYVEYLDQKHEEVVQLLDVISTNVTSFYREAHHFQTVQSAMDGWLADGQTRFRVWSAACSTGEEPYTLAMTLQDAAASARRRPNIKILATDISTRVLAEAEAGAYASKRVESIPTAQRRRYLRRDAEMFHVAPPLKEMTVFRRMNLSKPPFPMRGPLDFIFCRNVMIYFDEPVREALLREFHRLLRPDGYLMVGHAESLASYARMFARAGTSTYRPISGDGLRERR